MQSKQCINCAWLLSGQEVFTCYAYAPGPIPEEIATGEVSHATARGDEVHEGIVYMPLTEEG
jgi:hypothetical protein